MLENFVPDVFISLFLPCGLESHSAHGALPHDARPLQLAPCDVDQMYEHSCVVAGLARNARSCPCGYNDACEPANTCMPFACRLFALIHARSLTSVCGLQCSLFAYAPLHGHVRGLTMRKCAPGRAFVSPSLFPCVCIYLFRVFSVYLCSSLCILIYFFLVFVSLYLYLFICVSVCLCLSLCGRVCRSSLFLCVCLYFVVYFRVFAFVYLVMFLYMFVCI